MTYALSAILHPLLVSFLFQRKRNETRRKLLWTDRKRLAMTVKSTCLINCPMAGIRRVTSGSAPYNAMASALQKAGLMKKGQLLHMEYCGKATYVGAVTDRAGNVIHAFAAQRDNAKHFSFVMMDSVSITGTRITNIYDREAVRADAARFQKMYSDKLTASIVKELNGIEVSHVMRGENLAKSAGVTGGAALPGHTFKHACMVSKNMIALWRAATSHGANTLGTPDAQKALFVDRRVFNAARAAYVKENGGQGASAEFYRSAEWSQYLNSYKASDACKEVVRKAEADFIPARAEGVSRKTLAVAAKLHDEGLYTPGVVCSKGMSKYPDRQKEEYIREQYLAKTGAEKFTAEMAAAPDWREFKQNFEQSNAEKLAEIETEARQYMAEHPDYRMPVDITDYGSICSNHHSGSMQYILMQQNQLMEMGMTQDEVYQAALLVYAHSKSSSQLYEVQSREALETVMREMSVQVANNALLYTAEKTAWLTAKEAMNLAMDLANDPEYLTATQLRNAEDNYNRFYDAVFSDEKTTHGIVAALSMMGPADAERCGAPDDRVQSGAELHYEMQYDLDAEFANLSESIQSLSEKKRNNIAAFHNEYGSIDWDKVDDPIAFKDAMSDLEASFANACIKDSDTGETSLINAMGAKCNIGGIQVSSDLMDPHDFYMRQDGTAVQVEHIRDEYYPFAACNELYDRILEHQRDYTHPTEIHVQLPGNVSPQVREVYEHMVSDEAMEKVFAKKAAESTSFLYPNVHMMID